MHLVPSLAKSLESQMIFESDQYKMIFEHCRKMCVPLYACIKASHKNLTSTFLFIYFLYVKLCYDFSLDLIYWKVSAFLVKNSTKPQLVR